MEILKYPNPRLREEARTVKNSEILTNDFRSRCWTMLREMEKNSGVGLAATQVGWDARVFVMRNADGFRRICINPEWKNITNNKMKLFEGCLSFPDQVGLVERFLDIRMIYTDITGSMRHEAFHGVDAQCVQHEVEHLEGILLIDNIKSPLIQRRNENEAV